MNGNDTGGRQVSAREILAVIFRRRVAILVVAAIVTAATLTAASRTTSVFEGTTKVLVRRSGASPLATSWTPFFGLEEEMNTEVEIVTSAFVLERAVEILKEKGVKVAHSAGDSQVLRDPNAQDLAGGISAVPVEMSNVLLVRFTGAQPNFVVEAANATAEAYVEHRARVRSSSGIENYFREQLTVVEARILELVSAELEIRKKNSIYDEEWQYRVAIGRRSDLLQKLAEVKTERVAEEEKLQLARSRIQKNPDLLVPFARFDRDKLGGQMLSEYWTLREERDEKATVLTESNPEVQMLDARIEKMEQRFKEETQREIEDKQFLVEELEAEEDGYQEVIDEITKSLEGTPDAVAQIQHLQREINYTYLHYDKMLEKMLDTMASEANDMRLSNAKIISPARIQLTKVGKMQTLYVAFSVLLGISLGVGFGFLLDNIDHSVRSAADVEDNLGMPLLGSVPDSRRLPQFTTRVDRTFGRNS